MCSSVQFSQIVSKSVCSVNNRSDGTTEVTTETSDTSDHNDRPVAVGGIGKYARQRSGVWGGGADYRNKLFCPHPTPHFYSRSQ